jgi:hypothetical protein
VFDFERERVYRLQLALLVSLEEQRIPPSSLVAHLSVADFRFLVFQKKLTQLEVMQYLQSPCRI